MRCFMTRIFFAFILMSLSASPAYAALKLNADAPTFSLKDRTGNNFSLDDVVGVKSKTGSKGLILGFFASWCIPCRHELPLINSLVDELQARGVTIVLVDVKEDLDTISALLAELKVNKPLVLSDRFGKVSEAYSVRFLPATFFIGADGKVKDIIYGEIRDEQELRGSAQKLFKNDANK